MSETSVPIVDARSGKRVRVGEWVHYPPDMAAANPTEDDWKLLDVVSVGLFEATLMIGRQMRFPGGSGNLSDVAVRCPVRWFHPAGGGAWRVILVPT